VKTKHRNYPHAWPGNASRAVLTEDEVRALRCSMPGCERDYAAPGGLKRIGGMGDWRCAEHRDVLDHGSHRLDLRQAQERAVNAAVSQEQKRIALLLKSESKENVLALLRGIPRAPEPATVPEAPATEV
jgi:hypothetical protein